MTISILVHYFFMCTMTFYCLEALHTYSMITYVVPVRGYLSAIVNIVLGYGKLKKLFFFYDDIDFGNFEWFLGIPVVPLAFSVGFLYNSYGSNGRQYVKFYKIHNNKKTENGFLVVGVISESRVPVKRGLSCFRFVSERWLAP